MYRRILLTHDGSELADAAIPHAAMLAKATGAPVLVVQVVDSVAQVLTQGASFAIEPATSGQITAEIAEESVAAQHEEAEANLATVAEQLKAEGIENVETKVVEGRSGEAISEAAADEECDLIVIASHGRSGIKRAVLGSVADHVARNTPHSAVLLIRPPTD